VDRDRQRRLPITNGTVRLTGLQEGAARRLRVIVGTEAFAQDHSGEAQVAIQETRLRANAPNPFRRSTTIAYQLAEPGAVTLRIYDMLGRRVATLADGYREAGVHHRTLDARGWASGVYFCRLRTEDHQETRKIVLAR